MKALHQSPTEADFVQNPYPFYETARAHGPWFHWADYDLPCTGNAAAVNAVLRDRRLGREAPAEHAPHIPAHLAPFYAVEAHSMLELEGPRHARLRSLVLRAFTSRRIAALGPEIATLAHSLIDQFPNGKFDLLPHFAQRLPVIVIARLLGMPEDRADDLLAWSNAMVGMYMAGRTPLAEARAVAATEAFVAFMRDQIATRRDDPRDDLLSALIAAEDGGQGLSNDEMITTCILLLNAGHEATVHTLGNGVKLLLQNKIPVRALEPDQVETTIEEILRFDPALHLFTRWVYEDVEIMGQSFRRGDRVGLLLAAANRDPGLWDRPAKFLPARPIRPNLTFGAGVHFCLGAPLARLELTTALPILFSRLPGLKLSGNPRYGDTYHFHGLRQLMVTAG